MKFVLHPPHPPAYPNVTHKTKQKHTGLRCAAGVAVRGNDRPPGDVPLQARLQGNASDARLEGAPDERTSLAVWADGDVVQHPAVRVHVEQYGEPVGGDAAHPQPVTGG